MRGARRRQGRREARPQQTTIFSVAQTLPRTRKRGLQGHKPGPKRNYVRTNEVVRQVIRHRFLDPDATIDIIAQKLRQSGFPVSVRSVVRVIEEYGLQKKTVSLPPGL